MKDREKADPSSCISHSEISVVCTSSRDARIKEVRVKLTWSWIHATVAAAAGLQLIYRHASTRYAHKSSSLCQRAGIWIQ